MEIILAGPILFLPFIILLVRELVYKIIDQRKKRREATPVETEEIFDHLFIEKKKVRIDWHSKQAA